MMSYEHYVHMGVIMIVAGLLSSMNVWADKLDDVSISLNDVYMTLLMTGWMFLFMGVVYKEGIIMLIGIILVITNIWCIRTQFSINETQYLLGMTPHHSMAVHMSRKLLEKRPLHPELVPFLESIIRTQEDEIRYMKSLRGRV